jgi:hypothetical protein
VSAAEAVAAARDDEMRRRADVLEEWHEHAMGYGVVDLDEERDKRRETECPVCSRVVGGSVPAFGV